MEKRLWSYDELLGKRVAVYRNLTRDTFSVQYKGIVVSYQDEVHLADVEFRVSQAGRRQVLRERCKNVHAKVWGTVVEPTDGYSQSVYYNPYETEQFETYGEPVLRAEKCLLKDGKVWI